MPSYKTPIRDMLFVINELWDIKSLMNSLPIYNSLDPELLEPILEEAAKYAENELFPLNQVGDKQGCRYENNEVITPTGFKQAYKHFIEGGWMSLSANQEFGGQGLPKMLQILIDEMLTASNVSFSLYIVLTLGTYQAIHQHGTQLLKQLYLPKLVTGEWSGTMCLTEPHCGTDLSLLQTKADPSGNNTYKITGTKIFITSGEHDLTDNIIHTVLARLPDAPAGVKGISLFLVPKVLVNADGSLGDRNSVYCGSIEHKMGIKGSSTCVMNFEGATGYLLGEKNQGMAAMFTMMNLERINIGLQGLGLAEIAYQNARNYALERLQGRAPEGPKFPSKSADPIIVHPDVRRMLLTIKAHNEAARAFACWMAMQVDISKHHPDEKTRRNAEEITALLTPVIKAFFSDYGFNACNLALQVFGGHGYVAEWGMEQYVRDARIAQIYEGANGIQALDLVKRKLIMNHGETVNYLIMHLREFIQSQHENKNLQEFTAPLANALDCLEDASRWILAEAEKNPAEAGAASYDYLNLFGLTMFAFMWVQMAKVALAKINSHEQTFYQAKIETGRFFMTRILPQVTSLLTTIKSGSQAIMSLNAEDF